MSGVKGRRLVKCIDVMWFYVLINIEHMLNMHIKYIEYMLNIYMEGIMTKKEEQHEIRKWQILDIALSHFIRYGFYGTSTRKIAEEAGISSGLMFHYFPNKLALYEALVEIGCDKLTIDSGEGESPLVFFEKQVEWFLSVASKNNFASRMFVFMGLVAINASDISERAAEMIKNHDVEAMSVPYIEKGAGVG